MWTAYPFSFIIGPLFFLYIRFVFSDKKRLFWYDALHFLPFAWELYSMRGLSPLDGRSKIELYLSIQAGPQEVSSEMLTIALKIAVVSVVYFLLSYLTLRKRKRSLADRMSDNAISRNIDQLQILVCLFITISIGHCASIFSLYTIGSHAFEIDYVWLLGKSLVIHTAGYLAINRSSRISFANASEAPTVVAPIHPTEPNPAFVEKYAKSGLSEIQIDEFYERLLLCIENDAPHLNCELHLAVLANLVGMSNNHLSQVINQRAKQNFNDFINQHRVKYAKKLFEDSEYHNRHNVIEIAFKAGFNSKASFNRAFKKHTGQTPTDFRNKARQQREAQMKSPSSIRGEADNPQNPTLWQESRESTGLSSHPLGRNGKAIDRTLPNNHTARPQGTEEHRSDTSQCLADSQAQRE